MSNNAQFVIRLGVNSSGVTAGINAATAQVDRFGKRFAGMLAAGSVTALAKKIIDSASEVADTAQTWQASSDFVQQVGFAAKQSSVDLGQLQVAYRNTRKAQVEALEGGADQIAAFERLGISIKTLKTLRPEDLFRLVAQQVERLPRSARVTADALTIIGQKNDALVGVFQSGFGQLMASAKDAGQVIEESVVKQLDDVGDRLTALGGKFVVTLAPGIAKLAEMADVALDFVNQTVGGLATAAGAFVRTGSLQTAMEEAAGFVKAEAKKQAEAASHAPKTPPPPRDASDIEVKEKKKKEKKEKLDTLENFGADAVGGQAQKGIFVGGRAGEITRIPQQTLEETRAMRRGIERLEQLQREAVRTGNGQASVLRDIYRAGTEDS